MREKKSAKTLSRVFPAGSGVYPRFGLVVFVIWTTVSSPAYRGLDEPKRTGILFIAYLAEQRKMYEVVG